MGASQLSGRKHEVEISADLFLQSYGQEGDETSELQILASNLKFEIARMATKKMLYKHGNHSTSDNLVMHVHENHCGAWRIEVLKSGKDESETPGIYQDAEIVKLHSRLSEPASVTFIIKTGLEQIVIDSDEAFFEYFMRGAVPERGGPLRDMDSIEIDFDKIASYGDAPKAFTFHCSDDDWDVMDDNSDMYVVHPVVCRIWNFLLDPGKCSSVLNCVMLLNCEDTEVAPCGQNSALDLSLLISKTCPLERIRLMRTQVWPFWEVPCLGGKRIQSFKDAEWMGEVELLDYSDGDERKVGNKEAFSKFRGDKNCCVEHCQLVASYGDLRKIPS